MNGEDREPRRPVITFMTQAEYEARRRREHPLEANVLLVNFTKYDSEQYPEEHIPEIIAEAAIELGTAPETVADDPDGWTARYDCAGWPFRLKAEILDMAANIWAPGNSSHGPIWTGERSHAEEFFRNFPELKETFRRPPEEIARRWSERNGPPPQAP